MAKNTLVKLIWFYKRAISPFLAGGFWGLFSSSCRFYPTCSDYAIDAVSKYGAGRGTLKVVGRILRCNPLSESRVDEA